MTPEQEIIAELETHLTKLYLERNEWHDPKPVIVYSEGEEPPF